MRNCLVAIDDERLAVLHPTGAKDHLERLRKSHRHASLPGRGFVDPDGVSLTALLAHGADEASVGTEHRQLVGGTRPCAFEVFFPHNAVLLEIN